MLLIKDMKHNVDDKEESQEALDDERVVGEPHHVIEHARESGTEEVPGGEGGGEETSHHGLSVGSCGLPMTNS